MPKESWMFHGHEGKHNATAGLVALGDWAVPREVTWRLLGAKDYPSGKRWPDVFMRFEVRDGAAMCTEFRVVSDADDRGIRSGDLRIFDLDEIALIALSSFGYKRNESGTGWSSDGDVASAREGAKRGVHNLIEASYRDPAAELLEVAKVYLHPSSRGKPTDSVMEVLGYGSRATASRKVRRAREAGLIPAPGASTEELDAAFAALEEGASHE